MINPRGPPSSCPSSWWSGCRRDTQTSGVLCGYVLDLHARVVEDCLEDENGSGWPEDGERLSGEESVGNADDETRHQRLHGRNPVICGVPEQATERDDGRQTREVDKDVGSDALDGEAVLDVGPVAGIKRKRNGPLKAVHTWNMKGWCTISEVGCIVYENTPDSQGLFPLDICYEPSKESPRPHESRLLPLLLLFLLLVHDRLLLLGMFATVLRRTKIVLNMLQFFRCRKKID